MQVWAKTLKKHKIVNEVVRNFDSARPSDLYGWEIIIHELCQELDLSRPVILTNHVRDLNSLMRVVFKASDFMEPISFDRFEIEVLPEKKRNQS